jgi:acetyl esterase/lipase
MSKRDTYERLRKLVFREIDGKALTLDLYLPESRINPVPVVAIVHGGAWFVDNTGLQRTYARALAENGIAAATVGFRCWPKQGFRDQVADIKAAVRWLRAHAGEYGLDPDRMGMYGTSSGSHLAPMACLTQDGDGFGEDGDGSSEVQALFCLYGLYDVSKPVAWFARPVLGFAVRNFTNGAWREGPDALAPYSPLSYARPGAPKTLLVHGTWDTVTPVAQAEFFAQKLKAYGNDVEVHIIPRAIHGFSETCPWTRPATRRLLVRFMQETFGMDH